MDIRETAGVTHVGFDIQLSVSFLIRPDEDTNISLDSCAYYIWEVDFNMLNIVENIYLLTEQIFLTLSIGIYCTLR